MLEKEEAEPLLEICWWCDENWPISTVGCGNCGNILRKKPKPDWDQVKVVFPDGMPSCGLTDAAILGGSDAEAPTSGTIYLNK